jgi:hypothetical protein
LARAPRYSDRPSGKEEKIAHVPAHGSSEKFNATASGEICRYREETLIPVRKKPECDLPHAAFINYISALVYCQGMMSQKRIGRPRHSVLIWPTIPENLVFVADHLFSALARPRQAHFT